MFQSSQNREERSRLLRIVLFCGALGFVSQATVPAFADEIRSERAGKKFLTIGSVKYENEEDLVVETPYGSWISMRKAGITGRAEKPVAFLPPAEMIEKLLSGTKDNPLVRIKTTPECLVVLILESAVKPEADARIEEELERVVTLYNRAAKGVSRFAIQQKLTQSKPDYPAVVCLYESDILAEKQFSSEAKYMGIGRVRSEGWYSPASNVASFSLSQPFFSSESTAVYPLIWQQFFHTGLLKRKAPIPLWFLVGLAAGFDSSAALIEPNHSNLSVPVTSSLDFTAKTDWDKMISEYVYYFDNEKLYFSDFRNESWGLHWYLINKNKAGYEKYWKAMSELTPLDKYVTEETLSEFKTAFGKPPKFYKPLYVKAIKAATKSNPNRLPDEGEYTYQRSSFGVAKMRWLDSLGQVTSVNLDGTLTNKSPIRARCFCVGCVTAWGKTATWFVDNVEPNQTVELPPKRPEYSTDEEIAKKEKARKKNAGLKGADYPSEYWIKSVPIDSPEAEKWRKGELPSTLEENE